MNHHPLVWHVKASSPGVASAHCVIFASSEVPFTHDAEVMNSLVHSIGKLAGTIDDKQLVSNPVRVQEYLNFILANFPT